MTNDTALDSTFQDDPEFNRAFHIFTTWYGKLYFVSCMAFVCSFYICCILVKELNLPYDHDNAAVFAHVCLIISLLGIRELIPAVWYTIYRAFKPMQPNYEAIEAKYAQRSKEFAEKLKQKAIEDELQRLRKALDSKPLVTQPSTPPQPPMRLYTPRPRNRAGYVYLLSAIHDDTLYKIGRTNNPKDRLRTFNVKLPFPVEYACVIQSNDMCDLETQLHRKYRDKRVEGEFFRLTPEDVTYIKSLATSSIGGAKP